MATFTSHRGLKWHYEAAGSGETLLLIHGFGGSGRWWNAQKESLRADFQVITVDLPGHGQSSWLPVNLSEMAADLRELLEHLGVVQFSIVASSLGCLAALELYRLMPQEVMRMSFVGGMPKFARGPHYPAGLDIEKIRTLSRQFDGDYAAILEIFFRSLFTMQERDSERFKSLKALRQSETLPQREALKHFLDILEKADLRDRLDSMICPLQFIAGAEDYICPRAVMDWMKDHTRNARFDFIDKTGHLPFLTEVKEYNRLLEDFLLN